MKGMKRWGVVMVAVVMGRDHVGSEDVWSSERG